MRPDLVNGERQFRALLAELGNGLKWAVLVWRARTIGGIITCLEPVDSTRAVRDY